MMRTLRPALVLASASLLGGCGNVQTSFGGQGEDGAQFISLFWIFLAVTALVYLLVIGFLVAAIMRRRRSDTDAHTVENRSHYEANPALRPLLLGWAALIVTGLSALAIASFVFDRSLAASSTGEALTIDVTGNQWWWNVEYVSADPSRRIRTANELHLPVNVPVRIRLHANDVIHSLWIPNLTGKQDLIPGRDTDLNVLARKPGLYRAQCAEFCGVQHAHMALDVTVESRAEFEAWWKRQLAPAAPPATPLARAGYDYVTTRECQMCHNISGTPASARVGPDLTHVASRRSIAAGTMPMGKGNLYAWIADPQSQKPGSKMPTVGLEPAELHAVVGYLEGLK